LGFRGVKPIHAGTIDEARETDRYLRQQMRLASCLQQQNAKAAVLCEPVGECRARRSGANDDEIDGALVHSSKSPRSFSPRLAPTTPSKTPVVESGISQATAERFTTAQNLRSRAQRRPDRSRDNGPGRRHRA